jgi:membrane protein implicated in regulation of membrane protease activity
VQPSPKVYKAAGYFSCISAVVLFLMSLLLFIVEPVCGIIFAVFAVLIFILGRKYIKRSKAEQ